MTAENKYIPDELLAKLRNESVLGRISHDEAVDIFRRLVKEGYKIVKVLH